MPSNRVTKKSDVHLCEVVVCIYEVMLVVGLPGSSPPFPFDTRTRRSTRDTLNFALAEFQDTILESTDAHLQTAVPS